MKGDVLLYTEETTLRAPTVCVCLEKSKEFLCIKEGM